MKGGMQSSQPTSLICKCGKETSEKLCFGNTKQGIGKDITIHFGKKTYWHIYENFKIRRTFKQPEEWE